MSQFHFTQTAIDEELYADVQSLNGVNGGAVRELFRILAELLGDQSSSPENLLAEVDSVAAQAGVAPAVLRGALRGFFFFSREALKANMSPDKIKEDLENLGLNPDFAAAYARVWRDNHLAFSRSLLSHTLSVNELVDMKWRFGVTTATNEKDRVGAAFMQFKFTLNKGNGESEVVHMEMTLPQFYDFLHQMETAKEQVDFFG